jgi:diacylglycerol kinase (ATP)
MPQDLSMPTPEQSEPLLKRSRDLAWKIAPTLLLSFKYAWAGLRYAFITQRNFRIHTVIGTLALSLGVFLKLSAVEIAVICLTSGLVLALELLNTAIESGVDLTVKQSYHELAKIAKDCAAGAVLVSAIAAVFVAGSLLLPPLLARIQAVWF